MKKIIVFILFGLILVSYTYNVAFPTPEGWPKPAYNFNKNPLDSNKILLGRALFYEQTISENYRVSCASCHSPYNAFAHNDHALSHGIHDRIGTRNSPGLMNLAWQNSFMWDGAINHLDMQALAPISHPDEMASNMPLVISRLRNKPIYVKLFQNAYGDTAITGERTLKAFSQFLLTLISANSKYDKVKRGEVDFTEQELNGYNLFKTNCSSCHKEPLFHNNGFENNGLPVDKTLFDIGRAKISNNSKDSFKFRVPTLRNIEYTYPYMHDGRFKKLSEVLNHYTNGIVHSKFLAKDLKKPIELTANEKVDLTAFLLTLSDKEFIFNANYRFPVHVFATKYKE